ncbi:MAG: NAD(+)/NADH kinase [Armatimonadetes bacterium]|nr:NAD(+)/NADH kinase [Armatimonadota bacterium]
MINTVGLVVNPGKESSFGLAAKLAAFARETGCEVVAEDPVAARLGLPGHTLAEVVAACDVVLALGGDGTLLRVAREAAPLEKPIVGIHFGRYGFIMETDPSEALEALGSVLRGDYTLSSRLMLQASLTRAGLQTQVYSALNDVVIARGTMSRLVRLRVNVGPQEVVRYSADGIIIATPTGSTAYSLSAGGPVIHPDVDVVAITPIAPHTLNSRALVIPAGEPIEVTAEAGAFEGVLTVDGQLQDTLQDGDVIRISRAPFVARLVQTRRSAFYLQLESRLGFGERYDR